MMPKIRVGIVSMPRISVAGGFVRVARDLVAALKSMKIHVSLLTPFEVDVKKINKLYGLLGVDRFYYPSRLKSFFSREEILGRKLLKKEFRKMAEEVDFIIDLDGTVFHKYLPNDFDKKRYVVWRVSCINPETYKTQKVEDRITLAKILVKKFMKKALFRSSDIPRGVRVYALDDWTKKEISNFWNIRPEIECLYPGIHVKEFSSNKNKQNKVVVFGRIANNKSIEDCIKIFFQGTKNHPEYRLVIAGGTTPDSESCIKSLNALIRNLGISHRVQILPDLPSEKVSEILSNSKIFLFSQRGVSLTVAAIEAMAAGCVVLSQKNGGTYREILGQGKYGHGFDTVEEGGEKLAKIIDKDNLGKLNNTKSINRADFFSYDNFVSRLRNILNY